MDKTNVQVLVLAAGGSTRFGSPKLMAPWRGKTLLEHTLAVAQSAMPGCVTVVLGADNDQLSAVTGKARVVINQQWQQGLSSSIKAGLEGIPDEAEHLLLMLADQVCVTCEDINRLLQAHACGAGITCAGYQQTVGIPAVFSRPWFPCLAELEGDWGAKGLIQRFRDQVEIVSVPGAALDIDRPADLAALDSNCLQVFCEDPGEGLH